METVNRSHCQGEEKASPELAQGVKEESWLSQRDLAQNCKEGIQKD